MRAYNHSHTIIIIKISLDELNFIRQYVLSE